MITVRNGIRRMGATVFATATISIASLIFPTNSIASSDTEALSGEARARLERQLAIAREERDAVVLETQTRISELTEALESDRSALAKLNDELEAAEQAQADAKTQVQQLTKDVETGRAEAAELRAQLEAAESALAQADSQVAELTEALDSTRETLEAQRTELQAAKANNAQAEAEQDERERLEQELDMAREKRDALVAETDARIAELKAALETERAERATLRDALEAAESALAQAQTATERPVSGLGVSQADATDLGGRLTRKGILVEFGPNEVRFESASADLPTTDLPTLDRIAERLEERPELRVRIEGHTDGVGSAEINQTLSQQRAEAVSRALIERGLEAGRVAALGAGSTQPIADNATEQGRRQNRRVELYLVATGGDDTSAASENGQ